MAQTPPRTAPDITSMQETALLRMTLQRMARYVKQMQDDLDSGELNLEHADQLGQSALTVLRNAAGISARAEKAARPAA